MQSLHNLSAYNTFTATARRHFLYAVYMFDESWNVKELQVKGYSP